MTTSAPLPGPSGQTTRRWAPAATVAVVLLLAIAAASGSVWFRLATSRRPIEFLGRTESRLLLMAPQATLYRLAKSDSSIATTASDENEWSVAQAPGFTHVRRCLLSDRSYDWDASVSAELAAWNWRLTLAEGADALTLDFDLERGLLRVANRDRVASIAPAVPALEKFLAAVTQSHAVPQPSAVTRPATPP